MPRLFVLAALAAFALTFSTVGQSAQAQILDPSVHHLERLKPLILGVDKDSSRMEPMEYRLKVGQGYRWKIKASDLTEYAFVAPAFIRSTKSNSKMVAKPNCSSSPSGRAPTNSAPKA